jgi:hypothetical protein
MAVRLQMYFEHEGTCPHFIRAVKMHLSDRYPGQWIGRGGAQIWPIGSPDLNILDFYPWGRMKDLAREKSKHKMHCSVEF